MRRFTFQKILGPHIHFWIYNITGLILTHLLDAPQLNYEIALIRLKNSIIIYNQNLIVSLLLSGNELLLLGYFGIS